MDIALNNTLGTAPSQEEDFILLPLRTDLQLMEAPRTRDGSPEWTLFDKVRQAFFRIGWIEFKILSYWRAGISGKEICSQVNKKEKLNIDLNTVKGLLEFLTGNQLLNISSTEHTSYLLQKSRAGKDEIVKRLLHSYLFFRIPLIKPDKLLGVMLPFARRLTSRRMIILFAIMAMSGLFLVSRQLESFQQTFLYFFNIEGILLYGITIIFVKILHELGHGLTAKHFGVRVPSMGLAFLVLAPLLYTDTTESWKLTSRRSRLCIIGAGVIVELCLALFAIFLWSFLPEGPLKSAAFFTATVSAFSTLILNLNPFMRFDGYYLLSDWLEMPNLQTRAFAIGKWWLRKSLFGFDTPIPEAFPVNKRRWLIIYSFSVWVYRALLFTSIAFMVYFLFFKVLGVFLMVVEIVWFLVLPVWNEFKAWYKLRNQLTVNMHLKRTIAILIIIAGILIFPWQGSFKRDAFIRPALYTHIFSPAPGKISNVNIRTGDDVRKDQVLITLESPKLEYNLQQAALKVNILEWYLKRNKTVSYLLGNVMVVEEQLAEAMAKYHGYMDIQRSLQIRAPFNGKVVRLENTMIQGRWVNSKLPLLLLADQNQILIETYIQEEYLESVNIGGHGRFFPENPDDSPIDATIVEIDNANTAVLKEPLLASIYGGDVPVVPSQDGTLKTHETLYKVILKPDDNGTTLKSITRGTLKLVAKRESILKRTWRLVTSVLIRESSF